MRFKTMSDTLEEAISNTTTHIRGYEDLIRGNWLATIPLAKTIRGAPGIRKLSLEGKTDHGEALRNVLTYETISDSVRKAFESGEFRFNLAKGFHGEGFDSLDRHTQSFLKEWQSEYLPRYKEFRDSLDAHDEIKNYRKVMLGALTGIAAGAAVGAGLDVTSSWLESDNVYWEIGARSLPAILEAGAIFQPFYKRLKEWTNYKFGKSEEVPKPFTPTEIWALTQLLGPFVGFGMLVVGEETGLNDNPLYRATAVFVLSTGNNVIGGGSALAHFYNEVRKTRLENNTLYEDFKFNGNGLREKFSNYSNNMWQILTSKQRLKDLKDDSYLALCNFWADSFQSSNVLVAGGWYSAEIVLRYFGVAAEQADFGGGFGGKTLAAIESGLLSCDSAAVAKIAIEREKFKLHSTVRKLTSKEHLDKLYEMTNSGNYFFNTGKIFS